MFESLRPGHFFDGHIIEYTGMAFLLLSQLWKCSILLLLLLLLFESLIVFISKNVLFMYLR
jgi:hypothetical protein